MLQVRAILRTTGLGAIALLIADQAHVHAQTTSSSIVGSVRTKGGETVPGAVVEARDVETGRVRAAMSDRSGEYRIDLLTPGSWAVGASLAGGQASQALRVSLRLQQVLKLDLTLGTSVTESVTVEGSAASLDAQRTGGELFVSGDQIDALPIASRLVTDVALLDSSVRRTPPGNFYGERGTVFIVNGQSGRANAFLVDGLDNNDQTSGTSPNSSFSQQVVKDIVVNTHQYAAEFGRATGAVFNIITATGSNETHTTAFVQGSHQSWNEPGATLDVWAGPSDLQSTTSSFDAGFRLSGPLRKDRAFYLFAFEHQQGQDVTPYTGVTRDGAQGGWAVASNPDDNLFFRADFNLAPTQSLMVRLSGDRRTTHDLNVGGIVTPERGSHVDEQDYQLGSTLTSVLSASALNEARLLVGSSEFDQFANSDRPGVERPSGAFGGNNLFQQLRNENRLELVDNLTYRSGSHTLKFGANVTRSKTSIRTKFNPNGNFTYGSDRPFQPGDAFKWRENDCYFSGLPPDQQPDCRGEVGVDDNHDGQTDEAPDPATYAVVYQLILGEPHALMNDTEIGLFGQDSWQVGPRLLLDYGARYDVSTFRLPASARVDSVIPNGGAPVDTNNVAPRFGFTFAPKPGGKLLLRGGAGTFYGKMVLAFPGVAAVTSQTAIALTFPQGFGFEIDEKLLEEHGLDAVLADVVFPRELTMYFSTGTRLDTPYTNQFSLGMEYATSAHGTLEAKAIRALGYHQLLFRDLNPPQGTRYPGIPDHVRDETVGSIAALVTEGRSWYAGLDLAWRWQQGSSFWRAGYTWSKALDMGPDPLTGGVYLPPDSFDMAAEKGRADADRRHRFVVSGQSSLPWMGLRLSGVFQVATGAPFNVTTGGDENQDGMTTDRPAGIGRNTGAATPLDRLNEFRQEASLPPASSLHEPSLVQLDLRVSKPIRLKSQGEGSEVFLQIFNLLDRFNGGVVEGRATAQGFGLPTGLAGPPRTVEAGVKLGF